MDRPLQELVRRRAGNRCEYCQISQERDRLPFEMDHIIAETHEGSTVASNVCLCCFACNRHNQLAANVTPQLDPTSSWRARSS